MTDTSIHELLSKSELELLSKSDFRYIQETINEPNIFRILSNTDYEIRHSNFIAWLLDATETHGCGTLFSNDLVSKLVRVDNPTAEWKVFREKYNIDLILTSPEETVVVENKTYSKDAPGQLTKYRELVESKREYKKPKFVYLNLKGEAPQDLKEREYWNLCSYSDLLFTLKNLCKEKKGEIDKNNSKTRILVEDYIDAVEVRNLKSGLINEKAKNLLATEPDLFMSIFNKFEAINDFEAINRLSHTQMRALKFIKLSSQFQRGKGFFRQDGLFRGAFNQALQKNNFHIYENKNTTYLGFISKDMLEIIPREKLPIRFSFRFFAEKKFLQFRAGIGPEDLRNSHYRRKLVDNLGQLQRTFGKDAVKARGTIHIGLYAKNIPFNPLSFDENDLENQIEELIKTFIVDDAIFIEDELQKVMLR